MKKLEEIKNGKYFTDDNGLTIMWQPILDRVKDPKGVITYRCGNGNPIGLFRVLKNEFKFAGEVKINDGDGDIFLKINGDYIETK